MNTAATHSTLTHDTPNSYFARAEAWLDARGKPGWVVAIVVGFIIFWPIGLALLAYSIWSKRMFNSSCKAMSHKTVMGKSSGNSAFDAYKEETLRRLQDEQANFEAFLKRLRDAKDKAEFDQFMADRASKMSRDDETGNSAPVA